jgi:isopentenyl diphosphate isomerase/L-lactate dehydrogenase-like FMN-dependent dehydrogenase
VRRAGARIAWCLITSTVAPPAGEAGAVRAVDILIAELRRDMVLLGAGSIGEIERSMVGN